MRYETGLLLWLFVVMFQHHNNNQTWRHGAGAFGGTRPRHRREAPMESEGGANGIGGIYWMSCTKSEIQNLIAETMELPLSVQ